MNKIASIIPIKLNNERLPGKNTKPLGGKPLIHYVKENLLSEPRIDEWYVFCSDEYIKIICYIDEVIDRIIEHFTID